MIHTFGMKKGLILFILFSIIGGGLFAQQSGSRSKIYGIVIKGGHVIDPKNSINELMDIAIQTAPANRQGQSVVEPRIALIAKNIDTALAFQVVDARGMYVTPGLIDIHTHVFYGPSRTNYLSNGSISVVPDGHTFKAGVTTVVDAGGAGWKSFATFKKNIIDLSDTRVLSFLNIVGEGMRGGDFEQNLADMDPEKAAAAALENKEHVVGFKLAHYKEPNWRPVELTVKAGKLANMPVMIDFGSGNLSLRDLLFNYLRPGDIYTHTYIEAPNSKDPVVDFNTRQLRPFAIEAQKRGIIFDVGFGSGSFNFKQALPALKAGFYPNTMGTDLHSESIIRAMKDQLNVMSIFLSMGMDIQSIIKAATWAPAQAIKREELGNLTEGGIADITILSMRKGNFGFRDVRGNKQTGTQKFECEVTIKGGKVVYDLNAIVSTNASVN